MKLGNGGGTGDYSPLGPATPGIPDIVFFSAVLGLTVCISEIIHTLTIPAPSCITYFVSICIADHPCDKTHSLYNDAKPEHEHVVTHLDKSTMT